MFTYNKQLSIASLLQNQLPINWGVLYVGTLKKYISTKEALEFINANYKKLNCNNKLLMEFNLYEEQESNFFNLLTAITEKETLIDKEQYINYIDRLWQLSKLLEIERATTASTGLEEIEFWWAQFDYPETWESFIYYMPKADQDSGSIDSVYNNFKDFIKKEQDTLYKVFNSKAVCKL